MYKLIKVDNLFFPLSSRTNKTYVCPILGLKSDFDECLKIGNNWKYFQKLKVIQIISGVYYQSIFDYKDFLLLSKKNSKKCERFSRNLINNLIRKREINRNLDLSKCNIMGVINLDENSFYKPSVIKSVKKFKEIINSMQLHNVEIIDIGGESSKPGAKKISQENEISIIKYFLDELNSLQFKSEISLDTRNYYTMKEGIKKGISIINDISGFSDKRSIDLIKQYNKIAVIMHMQGIPETMQINPKYSFPPTDIYNYFENKINKMTKFGINLSQIIIDPGFGFGKTLEDNLSLIKFLPMFHSLGVPILVGLSRKSLIKEISKKMINKKTFIKLDLSPENRVAGSLALAMKAYESGVQFIRTHDIYETKQAIFCAEAVDMTCS